MENIFSVIGRKALIRAALPAVFLAASLTASGETLSFAGAVPGFAVGSDNATTQTIESARKVATPTFSPAGGVYYAAQTITLSDTTPKTTIYWTDNGTTPTTSSHKYTGPIKVGNTHTFNAIAVASGSTNSSAATATYSLTDATPVISLAGGTYNGPQKVTITSATPTANIFYTTNGAMPTENSEDNPIYAGPITVSNSETLKVLADETGFTGSPIVTAAYVIHKTSTTSVPPGVKIGLIQSTLSTLPSMGTASVTLIATPLGGVSVAPGAAGSQATLVSGLPSGVTASWSSPTVSAAGAVSWTLTLTAGSIDEAERATLDLSAQIQDQSSGIVYSASQNIAVNVAFLANISIGTTPGQAIPATFMGLSQEWVYAQSMMGDSTTGIDPIYRQLLNNLTAYGSGPINLRIGGDSTDQSEEPTSTTALAFAELANALGTRFSLGVNLGSDNVDLAVDQANAFVSQMPAGSLDAIEIGNEPDMYVFNGIRPSPYTFADYLADFNEWETNILPLLPSGTKLMGPSWASPSSLTNAQTFDSDEASALTNFSHHFYVADGKATNNPDDILLTPSAATAGPNIVAAAVATAHQSGIPFRMGEMNSLYNGGEAGISDAFACALWSIDNLFEYVNVGVDGVNWHMGGDAVYAPFAIHVHPTSGNSVYSLTTVTPLYYGLVFFQAATGNGGHLLPVTLKTQANLTAWATVDASGTQRLAMINKDENTAGTVDIAVSGYSHAKVYRLTAPTYLSTSGVTFAGQSFDSSTDGTIQGSQTIESISSMDGVFQIPMPITSAALVVFSK